MPTLPGRTVIHIIGRIYEAAEDPRAWAEVLRLLGNEFRSTVNGFVLNDRNSPGGEVSASDSPDVKLVEEYNSYYCSKNVLLQRMSAMMKPRQLLNSSDVMHDSDLLATEYYEDFLRRWNIFYFLGGVITSDANSNAVLSLARSRKTGPFTSSELGLLTLVIPHFERAARLSGAFARFRQGRDEVLDRLPMGIIVLDESGKVEFFNRAAETILAKKDGLCWSSGGVSAVDPTQASRLAAAIKGAKLTATGKGLAGGGSLSITRSSAGLPLAVLVAPIMPSTASPLSRAPRVAMFITDPEATQVTNLERLKALFNLTPAESRMASQLLQGKSVIEAADALGITRQTARVHLKRIFGKTYTGRQSELMRLLLNSPATLRD
jgi:DNA-binding CsgD family transcriptional regulator/PAS domain-containing protein